ncbi:MAG: anthranilate synthase component I [Elusimicrobia bacterium CG08_land_8_20_14_0_20_44_26]|nr:MAG: anthranilate synthase component I [Elusimicrobia bacterium CG08_land_8_20_14_0_20_44_26]
MPTEFSPNAGEFKASLAKHGIACVYKDVVCDTETPVSIYLKLARKAENAFLLESAEGGIRWGRYSFVSASAKYVLEGGCGYFSVNGRSVKTDEPFENLRNFLKKYSFHPRLLGLPFIGGAVGYFSYDIISEWEDIKIPKSKGRGPEAYFQFMLPEVVIVVDHLKQKMKVISWGYAASGFRAEELYKRSLRKAESALKIISRSKIPAVKNNKTCAHFRSNVTKKSFENMVKCARKYIIDGDIIQTVISRRWQAKTGCEPLRIYRALRVVNPSPYMYFLKFGNFSMAGSSPEVLVKKTGRRAVLRPIAGTRKRGATGSEDNRLAEELLNDAKERAEHIMLVDLARNDLGRVCSFTSVSVKEFMTVEKFSHVIHLTSEVVGSLRKGQDSFSLFKACFPAGTVSGAPKVRAMQIISELEGARRGPYAGAVGYFSFNGDMDFAIAIRTIFFRENMAMIQAGAGIVYDSVPEKEYFETENKAGALLRAVELSGSGKL